MAATAPRTTRALRLCLPAPLTTVGGQLGPVQPSLPGAGVEVGLLVSTPQDSPTQTTAEPVGRGWTMLVPLEPPLFPLLGLGTTGTPGTRVSVFWITVFEGRKGIWVVKAFLGPVGTGTWVCSPGQ